MTDSIPLRATHALANLWPTHGQPAGLCILFDRRLHPTEQKKVVSATAIYNTDHKICYFPSFAICDDSGCGRIYLRAVFRKELRGEKMLRDSMLHVLEWLRSRTGIADLPDGFTGQEELVIPMATDPQLKVAQQPKRERRVGRYAKV